MIGLDTNVLVRYVMEDDPLHFRAAKHLLEHTLTEDEPGFVSVITLAELVWVLTSTYKRTNQDVLHVLHSLLQADNLVVGNEPEVFAAMMEMKSGRGSFTDALIGTLNTAAGCTTTLTFDRKASRLPGFRCL